MIPHWFTLSHWITLPPDKGSLPGLWACGLYLPPRLLHRYSKFWLPLPTPPHCCCEDLKQCIKAVEEWRIAEERAVRNMRKKEEVKMNVGLRDKNWSFSSLLT